MRQRRRVGPPAAYRSGAGERARSQITFPRAEGFIPGSRKDGQTVRPDWTPAQRTIDGVQVREVRHVHKGRGRLTEVFRADWKLDDGVVAQVFQVLLGPGEVSAWHTHQRTRDRIFVSSGTVRIVLYDARAASPTCGQVDEFRFGEHRPALLVVPAGVWHGVENLRSEPSIVLNVVDRAYSYTDPDHWRLPPDSPRIPFSFGPPARSGY
jgi:dTDP-4-dehydrorhamnose 3,5-epimerase